MATRDDEAFFLDTNVLVYANVKEAPFHEEAYRAIRTHEEAGHALWISRQVLREYLATLTRPQQFSKPVPASTLITLVHHFVGRFHVADERSQVTDKLLMLLDQVPMGGRQVHDANIVATMLVDGIPQLLTNNIEDFPRFSSCIRRLPLTCMCRSFEA